MTTYVYPISVSSNNSSSITDLNNIINAATNTYMSYYITTSERSSPTLKFWFELPESTMVQQLRFLNNNAITKFTLKTATSLTDTGGTELMSITTSPFQYVWQHHQPSTSNQKYQMTKFLYLQITEYESGGASYLQLGQVYFTKLVSNYKYKGVDLYTLCGGTGLLHSFYDVNGSAINLRTTDVQYDRITQGVNDVYKHYSGTAAFDPTGSQGLGAVEVDAVGLVNQVIPSWADAFKVRVKSKQGNSGASKHFHSGQQLAPNTTQHKIGGAGGAGKEVYVEDMYQLPAGTNYLSGAVNSNSSTLTIKSPNGATEYYVAANNGARGNDASTGHNVNYGSNGNTGNEGNVSTTINVNQVNGSSLPTITETARNTATTISSIYFFKL